MGDHPALTLVSMPSFADLNLPASPRADPLSYPGATIDADYLWLDDWLYQITPRPGGGLGSWEIQLDGGPLAHPASSSGERDGALGLDRALAMADAAPMAARTPVLSFGSNSAPAQLQEKFAELESPQRVVPVMRGLVRGLAVSHSAHISRPGYLPYVLVETGADTELHVFVLWLDAGQIQAMSRTELNYRLVVVDRYPINVQAEVVARYLIYQGEWGALRWEGEASPVAGGNQRQIFGALSSFEWFTNLVGTGDPESQMSRLRADPGLRDSVRVELARRGLASGDGLHAERAGLDYGL